MNKPKCIEAERFVECFGNWYTEEGTENGFIGTIKDLVKQTPAEDVQEVRHGHWINDNHLIKCSICGGPIPLNKVVLHGEVMWEDNRPVNYCPNCGAKMDGDTE